ncbi:hypothetical protein BO70DRAFT_161696 [Aspergillus heteromorphus CBS 117.55]|uniref:Uncharacterized protein n=1 Tax=Aspergillus heteromorphus CBS 117.55 TaxID=1448321 RepID=A0A317WV78_9EURO|nr:uncharacterized protein BO70DRAFT_161696 [Aspergillus heteromorphus CBS 117.55]PWY89127.1 hypothetical protein BO70DRAFT_161696 [Aspergillus heteromorphus CBS 117.55]
MGYRTLSKTKKWHCDECIGDGCFCMTQSIPSCALDMRSDFPVWLVDLIWVAIVFLSDNLLHFPNQLFVPCMTLALATCAGFFWLASRATLSLIISSSSPDLFFLSCFAPLNIRPSVMPHCICFNSWRTASPPLEIGSGYGKSSCIAGVVMALRVCVQGG